VASSGPRMRICMATWLEARASLRRGRARLPAPVIPREPRRSSG
jgi:hypothetical protein